MGFYARWCPPSCTGVFTSLDAAPTPVVVSCAFWRGIRIADCRCRLPSEDLVTRSIRVLVLLGVALGGSLAWPAEASAQRRAIRAPRARTFVYVGAGRYYYPHRYYSPFYYSPFYAGWYGHPFYAGWYGYSPY